jgi:putative component of membrane protein insertase Oxa1/YidC/SpoIIIJ protein YidD
VKSAKRHDTTILRGAVEGRFQQLFKRLSGTVNRFLLPWTACLGLFISTSNCPCCGQPVCPTGIAGMGIISGLISALIGLFRRRCISQPKETSKASFDVPKIPDSLNTPSVSPGPDPKKTPTFIVRSCLLVLLCAFAFHACAHSSQYRAESKAPDFSLYERIIKLYRGPLNHLESVRRGECPMYPSCSEYSRQAIARFGFVKGWIMTMDRLIRCGRDEIRTAPRIWVEGKWKYYDPVEDNDLWHSQPRS